MWTDEQVRILIDRRKEKNVDYHNLHGNMKGIFWQEVADRINLRFETSYTGHQAKSKFQDIVRDCKVSKNIYLILRKNPQIILN